LFESWVKNWIELTLWKLLAPFDAPLYSGCALKRDPRATITATTAQTPLPTPAAGGLLDWRIE
jgi:hypothetical protein